MATGSKFKELVLDLRDKIQYRDLTAILKKEDLPSAAGWEKLILKLDEEDHETATKALTILRELQRGLVVAGTKALFVYELDQALSAPLATAVAELNMPDGNYTASFPRALSENSLKQLSFDHELAARMLRPNGDVTLVFCAKRHKEERVTYDTSEVTDAVKEAFAGYDEFIAIRRTDYQVFDVVTVRRSLHRIEVLIDHPDRIAGTETAQLRCLSILGRLSTLVPGFAHIYEADQPLNLLPCINALYSTGTEGRVTKLSFRTPTKSVNRAALGSDEDLRTEAFHEGGVERVGEITPYDVTVIWDSIINVRGSVGVRVGMPLSGLTEEDTYVRDATILGAQEDNAVAVVVNKLVSLSTTQ